MSSKSKFEFELEFVDCANLWHEKRKKYYKSIKIIIKSLIRIFLYFLLETYLKLKIYLNLNDDNNGSKFDLDLKPIR